MIDCFQALVMNPVLWLGIVVLVLVVLHKNKVKRDEERNLLLLQIKEKV